jgi:hypothetical protein
MFLCRIRLGSHAVIIDVRLSTGMPRVVSMRSMWGMKMSRGRQYPFCGRTSGHAGVASADLEEVTR